MKRLLVVLGLILLAAFAGYYLRGVQQRTRQTAALPGKVAPADQQNSTDSTKNFASQTTDSVGSTSDSGAEKFRPSAKNPFIRALEKIIGTSPVLKQEQDDLQQQLHKADDVFSRAKQDNTAALRQASRQVRIRDGNSPNIILIVADELSYDDLGCYGKTSIETPMIDQMADEGTRFTQFYAGSANAPGSQWSLLTALQSTRAAAADSFSLRSADVTIAEMLWQAGYTTELIGDASLGGILDSSDPQQHGFDRWYGYDRREQITAYPEYVYNDATRLPVPENADSKQAARGDELLTREALASIQRHRRGRPFFLYLTYARSQQSDSAEDDHTSVVASIDDSIGLIRQSLKDQGMERNTVIFLTSECGATNTTGAGEADATQSFRGGRGRLYEGSIRVPLIVCGPGHIRGGEIVDQVCGSWDLLPTLADMVSAWHRPRNIDGLSLMESLRGGTPRTHEYLAWAVGGENPSQAVRFGNWKAVRTIPSSDFELYDLSVDQRETENVASQQPNVIEKVEEFLLNSGSD